MKLLCVLFVAAFCLVSIGLGRPAVRRLDSRGALTGIESGLFAFGIGVVAVYLGVFGVGLIRLDGLSMGGLSVALALAALPGLRSIPWRAVGATVWNPIRAGGDGTLVLLSALAAAVALSSLLQGLAPPNDFDSLMYHLALAKADIEQGRISPNFAFGMMHAFFPALVENLARLALATVGEGATQMFSATFGIAAAFAAGALARRAGFGPRVAALAGLMFLAVRAVVWEMATAEVEVALAAYCVAATLAYAIWREAETGRPYALLFGLMVGGALDVKYMALPFAASFAPIALWDLYRRRIRFPDAVLAGVAALGVFLPHMVRTAALTGNPVYPLFVGLLGPHGADGVAGAMHAYGRGLGLLDLVRAPWDIFILPAHYFDGFMFGAPYLLAFLPFGIWSMCRSGAGRAALSVVAAFFVLWFFLMGQQIRFLVAVAPMVATAAAAGAAALWNAVRDMRVPAVVVAALCAIMAANQAMFVGVYAALRLPPALGLMSPAEFHARTPTMQGAFYATCTYVQRHLKPGERYLSVLDNTFYYCPQTGAIQSQVLPEEADFWISGKPLPPLDLETFVRRLEQENIRFVIVQNRYESRRNPTATAELRPTNLDVSRFGRFIGPAVRDLRPLIADSISAVYDGAAVLARLRAMRADGAARPSGR